MRHHRSQVDSYGEARNLLQARLSESLSVLREVVLRRCQGTDDDQMSSRWTGFPTVLSVSLRRDFFLYLVRAFVSRWNCTAEVFCCICFGLRVARRDVLVLLVRTMVFLVDPLIHQRAQFQEVFSLQFDLDQGVELLSLALSS